MATVQGIERKKLGNLVPELNREWEATPEREVRIREPRFGNSAVGRWLGRKLGRPFIEVTLDRLGSAVWLAIDGRMTVRELVQKVLRDLDEDIPDLDQRIYLFLNHLARNRFIILH